METITIELNSPKARKLIDDLADLGIISVKQVEPTWSTLWNRLDRQLPQTEPDLTEADIQVEIQAYRREKREE
jgi:hypothetical protein